MNEIGTGLIKLRIIHGASRSSHENGKQHSLRLKIPYWEMRNE
jgi:hypothetical protein